MTLKAQAEYPAHLYRPKRDFDITAAVVATIAVFTTAATAAGIAKLSSCSVDYKLILNFCLYKALEPENVILSKVVVFLSLSQLLFWTAITRGVAVEFPWTSTVLRRL
ncbi:hypothetical protein STEG23_011944, partial [Scotinomys teguina]